jgi:hypothetical protein
MEESEKECQSRITVENNNTNGDQIGMLLADNFES